MPRAVEKFTFTGESGASVAVLSLGGILQSLRTPDRAGALDEIVCGFDDLPGYLAEGYFGAIIGRVCNRIGGARFSLDGESYPLFVNSGTRDCLHGGREGFNRKIWRASASVDERGRGVLRLTRTSPDGEEGFPGTLDVAVTYTFADEGGWQTLSIHYEATTDRATVVNLTNHSYFNLNGIAGEDVLDHRLALDADRYIETDADQIPLAEPPRPLEGTPFDFRREKPIGQGFDHHFVFTAERQNGFVRRRGTLFSPASGRRITLYTNLPGVQLYTGCVMNGAIPFKGGIPQTPLHAVCLETQFAPNSPNRPDYPPITLRPGEKYDFTTVYEIGVEE